jgi:hypothetical protein
MKSLFAALLLAAPLSAQSGPESYTATPEQYRGQLSRVRLAMLYPKLVSETTRSRRDDPEGRLSAFLAESAPVLKNVGGLTAYLHEGLRDPRAAEGSREWGEAWERLDGEISRLRLIVAEGEAFLGAPVPPQSRLSPSKDGFRSLEDKPEFDTSDGRRLHRALVFAAYAQNLREYLIRKSAEASADRARAVATAVFP